MVKDIDKWELLKNTLTEMVNYWSYYQDYDIKPHEKYEARIRLEAYSNVLEILQDIELKGALYELLIKY